MTVYTDLMAKSASIQQEIEEDGVYIPDNMTAIADILHVFPMDNLDWKEENDRRRYLPCNNSHRRWTCKFRIIMATGLVADSVMWMQKNVPSETVFVPESKFPASLAVSADGHQIDV